MIKVLVVHDTLHEAKKIEHYIISYYGTCSVLLCAGADKNEIMDIIENEDNEIDVCFTQIKMRSVSGIQIAQKLRSKNARVKIVFVSDTDEYALDAWRLGINDYLMEPVTMEKVHKSVENI